MWRLRWFYIDNTQPMHGLGQIRTKWLKRKTKLASGITMKGGTSTARACSTGDIIHATSSTFPLPIPFCYFMDELDIERQCSSSSILYSLRAASQR